jgi:hypothetical protein
MLAVVGGAVAVALPWTPVDTPGWAGLAGAVTVTTMYAVGLATRVGGHPLLVGALALVLAGAAAVSDQPLLRASAAVSTAALGAVLGVLGTRPAVRYVSAVREVLLATIVAGIAAFAVDAYDARVAIVRAEYVVLALALAGTLSLAARLAAGLTGLGRRGVLAVVSGLAILALLLAYGQALARWGSPELVDRMHQMTGDLRMQLGAVPRPLEYLLGFPALVWGVSTRARRRQGWWGCAFGATALALVATTLLRLRLALTVAGLGVGYALAVGLVLGFVLVATDRFVSGTRGRRARRAEEQAAGRPEVGRFAPLL